MDDGTLLPPVAAVVIGGTISGSLSVILLQALLVSLDFSEGLREIVFGVILLGLVPLFARWRD